MYDLCIISLFYAPILKCESYNDIRVMMNYKIMLVVPRAKFLGFSGCETSPLPHEAYSMNTILHAYNFIIIWSKLVLSFCFLFLKAYWVYNTSLFVILNNFELFKIMWLQCPTNLYYIQSKYVNHNLITLIYRPHSVSNLKEIFSLSSYNGEKCFRCGS
jgi:hypothetical protein